ncbi:MAG: DUF2236 domain-containing protein, partial [Myxococcales bacterium]|nr:DUF2236 domain-containing protein [Myxococcales bacterium]
PYSGRDPEAVWWVWATLADTAWLLYERFVAPLDAAACEAYYADHRVLARMLGVAPDRLAPDWSGFRADFDAMVASDRLDVTPLARDIAETVLHPPGDAGAARLARSISAGLLPPRIRSAYGLAWDERREARLAELVASVRTLRAAGTPAG